ncbi:hypothetical protein [Microbacterium telephonicum]|uniref:Uncharacterized protein n=1 Tax=Microbacterium telephonicum TaxID=1714841 RepID=A0A498C2Q9_9MICO|nr:hypothetical protein [Microbacterium telephonicum]RLK49329.1 hypothetical protein C7474_1472 [Microbacterium telephonicum]
MTDDPGTGDVWAVDSLTQRSEPGMYVVITESRTVYVVDLDPDRPPTITRYPVVSLLLHDTEPMYVVSCTFDVNTGHGMIVWWKNDAERPARPGYIGTWRHTTPVVAIARIPAGSPLHDPEDRGPLLRTLMNALRTLPPHLPPADLMAIIKVLASPVPEPDINPSHDDFADRGWASAVGPLFSGPRFSEIVQLTPAELDEAAHGLRVLRLPMSSGSPVYPELQLVGRLIVPGLREVLQALAIRSDDPWAWTRWLHAAGAPDSPITTLRGGRIGGVVWLAKNAHG